MSPNDSIPHSTVHGTSHDSAALLRRLEEAAAAAGAPRAALQHAVEIWDAFALMEWLVPRRGELPPEFVTGLTAACEALLRHAAFVHPDLTPAGTRVPVVFGTGGHRGEIGRGLTLVHVHVIVRAMLDSIAALSEAQRGQVFGAADLEQVKRRGLLLGHDNRLLNPEFCFYAAHLLRAEGYRVAYAGRISSPELSLLVPRQGWAGSLNFTPSHNPFRYGGVKFAPADGGLAGSDLSDPLAERANTLLQALAPSDWPEPEALERTLAAQAQSIERVDLHDTYLDALNEHPVLRLAELIETLQGLPPGERLLWVADPVWGAAVPVYRRLQARVGADVLQVLHTEDDPYFGGQTTEPNAQTLGDAVAALAAGDAAHKVAVRNDPDGDRGLTGDEGAAVKMNTFAPLVMRYLTGLGQQGDLATTHATSHQGPDFARAHGSKVLLTPTGFKNFRPYLADGRALVAYEESDGISIRGHTLDKDGVLAGLLAVRMVLHYRRPLSVLAAELEAELGAYHYRQETFAIDIPAAEARQRLARLAAMQPGQIVSAAGRDYAIREVNTEDGYKFILEGGAWLMMRPSGTEPKVRIYAESRSSEAETRALCAAGKALALQAVAQGAT